MNMRLFNSTILATLAATTILLATAGCQTPQGGWFGQPAPGQSTNAVRDSGVPTKPDPKNAEVDVTKTEEHDDVYEIASLLPNNPWIRGQGSKIVGLRVPAYFVSGTTRRGSYVPGTILAWVYGYEADAAGNPQRVPLHVWEFDRTEAMNWRITKRSVMGYPYMFLLRWPQEIDLEGRTIELELGYERQKDKQVVVSPAKRLKVPGSDIMIEPLAKPAPGASPSRMATSRKAK